VELLAPPGRVAAAVVVVMLVIQVALALAVAGLGRQVAQCGLLQKYGRGVSLFKAWGEMAVMVVMRQEMEQFPAQGLVARGLAAVEEFQLEFMVSNTGPELIV